MRTLTVLSGMTAQEWASPADAAPTSGNPSNAKTMRTKHAKLESRPLYTPRPLLHSRTPPSFITVIEPSPVLVFLIKEAFIKEVFLMKAGFVVLLCLRVGRLLLLLLLLLLMLLLLLILLVLLLLQGSPAVAETMIKNQASPRLL